MANLKKSDVKAVVEDKNDELEAVTTETASLDETAALDSLKPNSMPVGAANKAFAAAAAVKAINAMGPETINKFMASIAQIGHEADDIPSSSASKNKATIDTKEEVSIDDDMKSIIKEDISKLFEGEDLKEEFKEKVSVLFESAINMKVNQKVLELEEAYDAALNEELETIAEGLTVSLDKFLDYSVTKWAEANEVAIESTIRADLAESFVDDLHTLFKSHYITVPEDRVDVVEEMEDRIAELEAALNEQINEKLELESAIEELDAELISREAEKTFADLADGLAESDVERFRDLAESVEFTSVEDFKKKAEILKESIFTKEPTAKDSSTTLFEETNLIESEEKAPVKNAMSAYVETITNTIRG